MRFIVDTEQFSIERPDGSTVSWFDDGRALLAAWWLAASWVTRESYGVRFRGRPVIQLPGDLLVLHELVHRERPSVIIETGVAHGGSLLHSAAQLLLAHGDGRGRVIGIERDFRPANRAALDADPLGAMITVIDGDSTDPTVAERVRRLLRPDDRAFVVLDAAHDRTHVRAELELYAPLVPPGGVLVVMDTIAAVLARLPGADPAWATDNPGEAITSFLASRAGRDFAIDPALPRDTVTHFPGGVLRRADEGDE